MTTENGSEKNGEAHSTKMKSHCLNRSSLMSATTTFQMTTMILWWLYCQLLSAKPPPTLLPRHSAPLPPPPHCRRLPHPLLPPQVMGTLIVHLVRLPNSSPAEDPVFTEKSLLLSAITEHRATLPALHLEATREERPGCLVLTKRVAITGSRPTSPVAKAIRATSRTTTRPAARGGKMCETLHKRIFTDRVNFASITPHLPSFSATDCHILLLLPDSRLGRLLVLKHRPELFQSGFSG